MLYGHYESVYPLIKQSFAYKVGHFGHYSEKKEWIVHGPCETSRGSRTHFLQNAYIN